MVKDIKNDKLAYDAIFESFNLFLSTLHHDVSASLRHTHGFASLLKEQWQDSPEVVDRWADQITTASQHGQAQLVALTQCMRRAFAPNTPEVLERLDLMVQQLDLKTCALFELERCVYTDPVKVEEIYQALDQALVLLSNDQSQNRIISQMAKDRRYLRIVGTAPTTVIRPTNVDRLFTPMKFDQPDRPKVNHPVIFQIKATAAALHGNAHASLSEEGVLRIEVILPDLPER
ncbi:hypothetical protein HJ526_19050 [Donghicola sp. C2-DW-16]|uniref:HAMP domain-containing histidine kinase n=1 Tax=Donghicola mangrovi TaxID=2729614 RepID=A0ABX2PJC0_9RHOB|nr:hypothetical protein [Donghicola mangrovi]NVO29523.1 hypothetical protein [Donghicola mangrovi]